MLKRSSKFHIAGQSSTHPYPKGYPNAKQKTRAEANLTGSWLKLRTDGFVKTDSGYAAEKQGNEVLIQIDSLEAIEATQILESTSSKSKIIMRIHHLLKNIKKWELEYISREENAKADRIAKTTFNRVEGLHVFTDNH
ncbi:hypothetical protein Golob_017226 [Gossypium lobatum]|uniref:RNase H type-1 domain-containing protein n=1 Tax=Gossypium lobatum TaxID=34289 RepID=A0A7J8M6G9_9ROSI|nr:hypothetical protein [Gossypium lobatum]